MSQTEIDRFQADVKENKALADKVVAAGHGLGAIVATAREDGYDFNLDELKAYIVAKSATSLSDDQLATIAAAGSSVVSTTGVAYTYSVVVTVVAGVLYGIVVAAVVVE